MTSELIIEAVGLQKHFGATKALQGVDLAVRRGTVLGVLGPNGAGKTTAVRILSTLLTPDAGRATIAGYDVVRDAEKVRQKIGLTGQYASVDEDLTGRQNLELFGTLLELGRAGSRKRATELLEWFDLSDAANRVAKTYSGGMRRRLDLAASLVGSPDVIFLDEPTTGLDPSKREDMWDVVRQLVANGSTVLLTTQYLEEADALADEITVIDHGRVIAHDTPEGLKRVVGGLTLEVRPAEPGDLPRAAEILTKVSSGTKADEIRRGVLAVPVADDSAMTEAVSWLAAAKIPVTELSLHLPSLDEVFFTLTGPKSNTKKEEVAV
ncbi:daunorubicin resistance protein DrrA family ABC transporter ATP-binding protein [Winogradskya consettensis]|uniref:Daunorubicin resistance protein DrrA family ABC transporter ATP-binding protein n=1 Tax=Winogradskya consettensis TaxID=113560 RepID=A0A919VWM9_9ACTN|nr:ATP-binding cassette domain-containing protein [Actinoplanes consettensis]GIM77770.1 daunorubicin resistance protein DrrA family ABC transporter ATP-binding protein [Actinoplanes consettensis]